MKTLTLTLTVVLFLVNVCHSEDTALHGLQGFTLHYAIAKTFGASKPVCLWVGVSGAIFGLLPDLPDKGNRFHTYTRELGMINEIPAFALHIGIDIPWHRGRNGVHWQKDLDLVLLDIAFWAVTIWTLVKLLEAPNNDNERTGAIAP